MNIPDKYKYFNDEIAGLNLLRMELPSWPTSAQLDGFVAAAGGLEMIDLDGDPLYTWLNDPQRDYSRYYR